MFVDGLVVGRFPDFPNPISNAHDQQEEHWQTYLSILKFMLSDIEALKTIHGDDIENPPKVWSMAPIASFQLRHILLDNTGLKNLCSIHRKINKLKVSQFLA